MRGACILSLVVTLSAVSVTARHEIVSLHAGDIAGDVGQPQSAARDDGSDERTADQEAPQQVSPGSAQSDTRPSERKFEDAAGDPKTPPETEQARAHLTSEEPTGVPGTGVYLKKGSMLHDALKQNKVQIQGAVGGLKELAAKKKKSAGSSRKTVKDEMSRAIYAATAKQGSYFHKTGPVPQALYAGAHADLSAAAHAVPTATGDPSAGVPHSALRTFKKSIVEAAVAIAAKKTAELRHKKAVRAKLQRDGAATQARNRVLQAQVKAAERSSKIVEKTVEPNAQSDDENSDDEVESASESPQ